MGKRNSPRRALTSNVLFGRGENDQFSEWHGETEFYVVRKISDMIWVKIRINYDNMYLQKYNDPNKVL